MKKLIFVILTLASMLLVSCGGGGSSSAEKSVSVSIRINKDSLKVSQPRFDVNGVSISKVWLTVESTSETLLYVDVASKVENDEEIKVDLLTGQQYRFSLEVVSSDDVVVGSASTGFITPGSDVTLSCTLSIPINIVGVAAAGMPVIGTVSAKGANGASATAVTNQYGRYSMNLVDFEAPVIFKVSGYSGGSPVELYSVSMGTDVIVNINPYTSLILEIAAGSSDLASVFSSPSGFTGGQDGINTALNVVRIALGSITDELGYADPTDFDPLNGTFVADGSLMDGVLDSINLELSGTDIVVKDKSNNTLFTSPVADPENITVVDAGYIAAATASSVIFHEVANFLYNYYIAPDRDSYTQSSNFGDYFNNFTRHNGTLRADYISSPYDDVDEISDVRIVAKESADVLYAEAVTKDSDGGYTKVWHKLEKTAGLWYIVGNELNFSISSNFYYTKDDSAGVYHRGIDFAIGYTVPDSVSKFVVSGPGLPSTGLVFAYNNGDYENEDIYTFNAEEYNNAFDMHGYVTFTVKAYNLSDEEYTSWEQTYTKFSRMKTESELSGQFIYHLDISLYSLIREGTAEAIFPSGINIMDGIASMQCEQGESSAYFTPSSPYISYSGTLDNFCGFSSCVEILTYYDDEGNEYNIVSELGSFPGSC